MIEWIDAIGKPGMASSSANGVASAVGCVSVGCSRGAVHLTTEVQDQLRRMRRETSVAAL